MRTTPILGSLLAAGLLAAGCASPVSRVAGDAAPVAAPAVAPSLSASPSTPAVPTPATPTPATSAPTGSAAPILGPTGFGALKLGMTRAQATATGLITTWKPDPDHRCYTARVRIGSTTYGGVYFNPQIGVSSISGTLDTRTPEGIHARSTTAEMLRAYPDWESVSEENPKSEGRGYADVPGNSKATYRIFTHNGMVVDVTLQAKNHGCYE